MKLQQLAKDLGRRGGVARARSLSAQQRQQIASLGGKTKYLSHKAIQRMERNFSYLQVVRILRKSPRVKTVSHVRHPLPGIYATTK